MSDDDAPPPPDNPKPIPLTKAEKLEAKAARLRESEALKAAQLANAGPPALGTRALIPWITAVAVLVLALLATFIYAAHEQTRANDASKTQHVDSLRDSVLSTARTVGVSFGTYSYKTLDADFARTRAYLTPAFAADFGKVTEPVGKLITQAKGQTVGTVPDVGIESITTSTAVVLVFLDQKVTSADSTTSRLDHNRLRLTLTHQPNGKWLVSKLTLV